MRFRTRSQSRGIEADEIVHAPQAVPDTFDQMGAAKTFQPAAGGTPVDARQCGSGSCGDMRAGNEMEQAEDVRLLLRQMPERQVEGCSDAYVIAFQFVQPGPCVRQILDHRGQTALGFVGEQSGNDL
ncbi:hypothetical protein GCM10010129_82370 [Streptomyces fumigatiscleroticus]|nr:hypothetical protein GCM10010129_82370 [Streptomyces fumigatiscleroticus]